MKPEDKIAARVTTLEVLLDAQRAVAQALADRVAPLETELAAMRAIVEDLPHVRAWRARVREREDAEARAQLELEAQRAIAEARAKSVAEIRASHDLQTVAIGFDPQPGLITRDEEWLHRDLRVQLRYAQSLTETRAQIAEARAGNDYFARLLDCGRLVLRDPTDDECLRYAAGAQ